jgi:hypothetical protein
MWQAYAAGSIPWDQQPSSRHPTLRSSSRTGWIYVRRKLSAVGEDLAEPGNFFVENQE